MLEMRTSERKDLKSCPQKWWWGNVEGLRKPRAANPLWFGIAVHEAMAGWYIPGTTRGEHPAETFDRYLAGERSIIVTNEDEEAEYVDARELGIDMLTRYVEHYGEEPHIEYIAPEWKGSVTFSRRKQFRFGVEIPEVKKWLRYYFTADGVKRNLETGEIWIDEHKTFASNWDDLLALDDQAGAYWAIVPVKLQEAGLLRKDEQVVGIEYNFLRKAMGDTRPFIVTDDGTKLYTNNPVKEHYITELYNHYGQDDPVLAEDIKKRGPKMKLDELKSLADIQGLDVHGDISKSQPPPYFHRVEVYRSQRERTTMLERIREEAFFSEAYRNGDLPVIKSPGLNCRFCEYKLICQFDETGDQESLEDMKEAAFIKVDPYEPYRELT